MCHLYKPFAISFFLNPSGNNIFNKRETLTYDLKINFSKKSLGQKFIDYLRPRSFNSLNLYDKKCLRNNTTTRGGFRYVMAPGWNALWGLWGPIMQIH